MSKVICLVKNGYPPQYSPEVFNKVMEQVENFEEHSGTSSGKYQFTSENSLLKVAEKPSGYGSNEF